jgi:hypothetical protein
MLLFDELLMRHGEGFYLTPKKKNKKKKKKSEIITSAENCWIILTITNSSYTTLVNK